jgi:PAS domain-containing protein
MADDMTERNDFDGHLQQLHLLLEGSDDLCAITDSNYHYLWANQAYINRHGLQRGGNEDRSMQEVLGADYFEQTVKPWMDRCLAGEVQRHEVERDYSGLGRRKLLVRYYPLQVP